VNVLLEKFGVESIFFFFLCKYEAL